MKIVTNRFNWSLFTEDRDIDPSETLPFDDQELAEILSLPSREGAGAHRGCLDCSPFELSIRNQVGVN